VSAPTGDHPIGDLRPWLQPVEVSLHLIDHEPEEPRETSTKTVSLGKRASSRAPIILVVAGVAGARQMTTSHPITVSNVVKSM
jgi:hypothetical protein